MALEVINQAQAERMAARAEFDHAPAPRELAEADIYAMINDLGDVGAALSDAGEESRSKLYRELRLDLRYQPQERAVQAPTRPRVVSECVRGGT